MKMTIFTNVDLNICELNNSIQYTGVELRVCPLLQRLLQWPNTGTGSVFRFCTLIIGLDYSLPSAPLSQTLVSLTLT